MASNADDTTAAVSRDVPPPPPNLGIPETRAKRFPWSTNEARDDARARVEWRERHLLLDYPFPCADDMIAHLRLPKYLTQADAERLKAAIDTLVITDEWNVA